jgi:hypothetical protein
VKDSFYEELECMFDKFSKYHMKILFGDFSSKIGREEIFKLTIGNENLHKISIDNGVRVVNVAMSKNHTVKSVMFLHHNIHKYTWMPPDGKTHIKLTVFGYTGGGIRVYLMFNHSGQLTVIMTTIWWWQKLGRGWQ